MFVQLYPLEIRSTGSADRLEGTAVSSVIKEKSLLKLVILPLSLDSESKRKEM